MSRHEFLPAVNSAAAGEPIRTDIKGISYPEEGMVMLLQSQVILINGWEERTG
jgi:hypothetical protein